MFGRNSRTTTWYIQLQYKFLGFQSDNSSYIHVPFEITLTYIIVKKCIKSWLLVSFQIQIILENVNSLYLIIRLYLEGSDENPFSPVEFQIDSHRIQIDSRKRKQESCCWMARICRFLQPVRKLHLWIVKLACVCIME